MRFHATGRRLAFCLREPRYGIGTPHLAGTERRLWLGYGAGVRVLDLP